MPPPMTQQIMERPMPTCALASDTLREEAATELGRLLINGDTASIKPVKLKQLNRASMTWEDDTVLTKLSHR